MSNQPLPVGPTVVVVADGPAPALEPGPVAVVTVATQGPADVLVLPGTPYGQAVAAALPLVAAPWVVLAPAAWADAVLAAPLPAPPPGIDAVVPHLTGPDGVVVEAGARLVDGRLTPVTVRGDVPAPQNHEPARVVDGCTPGVVAVRTDVLRRAGGPDPGAGPVQLVCDLASGSALAPSGGLVAWPGWVLPAAGSGDAPGDGLMVDAARSGVPSTPFRVVVAANRVPVAGAEGDVALLRLLTELARRLPGAEVVLLSDEPTGRQTGGLPEAGVGICAGPTSWTAWCRGQVTPDLLVLVGPAVEHRMADAVRRVWARAPSVLLLPEVPHRAQDRLRSTIATADEVDGVRILVSALREQLAVSLARVDAVWCRSEADAAAVRALEPLPVAVLPELAALPGRVVGAPDPRAGRRRVLVELEGGYDPRRGTDEAAAVAVEQLLPALRRLVPGVELVLQASRPDAALLRLARADGVRLVTADPDLARAQADVAVVCHPVGTGGAVALRCAAAAGLPVLSTRSGAGDDVDAVPPGLLVDDVDALALAAARVLTDDEAWRSAQAAGLLLADRLRPDPAATALRAELVRLGLPAGPGVDRPTPTGTHLTPGPLPMVEIDDEHGQVRVRVQVQQARDPAQAVQLSLDRARELLAEGGPRAVAAGVVKRTRRLLGAGTPAPPTPVTAIEPEPDEPLVLTVLSNAPDYHRQYREWLAGSAPELAAARDDVAARAARIEAPPTFTVVVPTWQPDAQVLGETVDSVLAQSYPHWQLVLSDDASPAPHVDGLLEAAAARDDRVQVVRGAVNGGISAATNAGLAVATGEFVVFCDHDDLLAPDALARVALAVVAGREAGAEPDVVYSDEDKADDSVGSSGGVRSAPYRKPDWSPNHLLSRNYLNHLTVVRRSLVEQVGGLRSDFDGSQDHDLLLRVTELTDRVVHVPEVLYTWRTVAGSTAAVLDAKPYAFDAARRALQQAADRRGWAADVVDGLVPSTYRVRYGVVGRPKVAVVIPTRDRVQLLRQCVESVLETSTWSNLQIVVVDNGSHDPETLEYLATLHRTVGGRVLRYPHSFNYARMMTLGGLLASDADQLLLLNNDTTVQAPDWIEALLEHAQRPEVGAVGARLYYPNGAVQHEGVVVNYSGGAAGNVDHQGWWSSGDVVHDVSAVTGAVTMMRPSVFAEVGGFEERLEVAFNDVDLCLRVRQAGYQVVYTPYATLTHHESASRGVRLHLADDAFFERRWGPSDHRDPFYNPHLDRSRPFQVYLRGAAAPGYRTDATGDHGLGLRAGEVRPVQH